MSMGETLTRQRRGAAVHAGAVQLRGKSTAKRCNSWRGGAPVKTRSFSGAVVASAPGQGIPVGGLWSSGPAKKSKAGSSSRGRRLARQVEFPSRQWEEGSASRQSRCLRTVLSPIGWEVVTMRMAFATATLSRCATPLSSSCLVLVCPRSLCHTANIHQPVLLSKLLRAELHDRLGVERGSR